MSSLPGILVIAFCSLIAGAIPIKAGNAESNVALNRAAYQSSAVDFDNVAHLATDGSPDTYWQSAAEDRPWIYVDLDRLAKISGATFDWGQLAPAACTVQVSTEEANPAIWTDVVHIPCAASRISDAHFKPVGARFVRMIADAGSAPGGCQLKQFEVKGEALPPPPPADLNLPESDPEGRMSLDETGWKLQNTLFVHDAAEAVSKPGFPVTSWLRAEVPGTALASYLKDGAIPDPNFGDQQRLVSESFFQNDFWYRKEFLAPAISPHQHFLLHFDGINWKADIFLNGSQVGHIDGAFCRGEFDVTGKLIPGKINALAVLIHKCANPGPTNVKTLGKSSHNGGILGKDNPTFQASIGWNWMPSIRGRDIGIWDHVYLEQTGPVVLVDPFVHTTVLKDRLHADLTLNITLRNLEPAQVESTLNEAMDNLSFSQKVVLGPNETKTLTLDKATYPQLSVDHPQLWWPNGYGAQPLQHLELTMDADGVRSAKEVTFGIRELTYDTSNNILKIFCNGQRIQLNGGNWGMDETMLRYNAKDYDIAVHYHQQMHMTMIRNWVGQVGKDEFFQACDKYGLLVWNDFWLANPGDGSNPDDHGMFMANVNDRILRIRNHPSLALYCGRNEGGPPSDLNQEMAATTSALDGTRYYIPNSASGLVTGHGPYEPHLDAWYFQKRGQTLHSELGIVCVPTADTMRLMMPENDLWPISEMWAVHDYFQARCRTYTNRINQSYGPSGTLDEFCEKAQLENWENAKAMMEAWRSNSGSGGLIWMSHPAWPSLICQLYDYFLNPTGAYFGVRKANEPLHILWDAFTGEVKVANNTGRDFENLHAEAWTYNMDGTQQSHQETQVNSGADGNATNCFPLKLPAGLTPVYFIKLKLTDSGRLVSDNFYWRALDAEKCLALNGMRKVNLAASFTESEQQGNTTLDIQLENPTSQVALMACVKVVKSTAPSQRILPIFYNDNYVSLLPHEKREIRAQFESSLLDGDRPQVVLDGWNVPKTVISK